MVFSKLHVAEAEGVCLDVNVYVLVYATRGKYGYCTHLCLLSMYCVDICLLSRYYVDMCLLSRYCVDRFCWFLAVSLIGI